MPASQTFQLDSKKTLKNIMNPKPIPAETSKQGKMEKDIMKHLMKESKKEAIKTTLSNKTLSKYNNKKDNDNNKNNDDHIEKENMINKIIKYETNKRFGPIINKELGFKHSRAQLSKLKNDNLETILHRIRTYLNTRNMDQVFQHMAKVSAKGYEELVTGMGYNIEGFQEILFQNPSFHDAFERWKIENGTNIPNIPPSLQLMYIIASTTYIAHISNAHIDEINEKKPLASARPKGNRSVEAPKTKPKDIVIKDKDNDIKKKEEVPRIKSNFKSGDIII